MKCKNCGGEIRLEDLYCPYCGRPNEEAHMHARDMQRYRQEFQKTRQDVIEKAGTQSRRAVRFAAVAFLVIAIILNIFLQANSYTFRRMWEGMQQKKYFSRYQAKIEEYLDAKDYSGFACYCRNRNIEWFDSPIEEYYVIYRIASNYQFAVEEIMDMVNPSRYSDLERNAKYASQSIQSFYDDLDPEKYSLYDSYDSPVVQEHIANMTTQLEAIFVAYLSMTPEEAQSLKTESRGSRVILIERGLEKYTEGASGGSEEAETPENQEEQ